MFYEPVERGQHCEALLEGTDRQRDVRTKRVVIEFRVGGMEITVETGNERILNDEVH